MKVVDVQKRIKALQNEIKQLRETKKTLKEDDISLYGDISRVIARRLHADNPYNIATRTAIFDPIMRDIKPLIDKAMHQQKTKEVA